ncbi:MAG TPA: hypothetical protein VEC36_08355 [Patescibacteria group bacterium]|nr:hypothetical protein [Patescibacteria group bacterium]
MQQIETLASLEGRALLKEIYRELRFDRQLGALSTLGQMWRICVHERELNRYIRRDITVLHPLGFLSGTSLWMQEIVNRYYFSSINSFVYFGAAILLTVIGVRRFTNEISDTVVIFSIGLEALLLIFMFLVMLFTPPEDSDLEITVPGAESEAEQLVREVGEISRDYADISVKLEKVGDTLEELVEKQHEMIASIRDVAQSLSMAVAPNPQLLETMKLTNDSLKIFTENLQQFSKAAAELQREEVELAVRRELEKIISFKTQLNGK